MEPIKIFYCYAHKDEKLRQELEKHLRPLIRSEQVKTWYDAKISTNTEWQHEVETQLNTAHIILLLLSPDFLASHYCYNIEMQKALERHRTGVVRLIPILVRPVDTTHTPLHELSSLPANGQAVTEWENQDEAFLKVTQGIREAVAELLLTKSQQSTDKLDDHTQNIELKKHNGVIKVYADKILLGRTIDLYEGDGKLHSSANITEQKDGEQQVYQAIFSSLNPGDYIVFIDWKYYTKTTVSANEVTEVDWRESSPLSNPELVPFTKPTELISLEDRPPQPPLYRKSHLLVSVSLILLLTILSSIIASWALFQRASPIVQITPMAMLSLHASIGVANAPDGETIGISDGTYVFDKTSPATDFKQQAAQKLRQGDISSAFSLLNAAHSQDTSDAEALIYLENLRLRMTSAKYITIVLGTSLTGDPNSISTGHDDLQGAYVAQREYNDTARQHDGVSVRLLIANSGSKISYASQVAEQIALLAQKDKTIVAVMGWRSSARTIEAIRPLSSAHIPMVSMCTWDDLTDISKYFFRVSASAQVQGQVAAQYAIHTLKAKRAAIFAEYTNAYTLGLAQVFQASFTSNGDIIVATQSYASGDATANPQRLVAGLQNVLQQHPDVIYFAGYPSDVSVLLKNMKPSDPPVIGSDALYGLGGYSDVPSSSLNHLRFTTQAYPNVWDVLGLSAQKPAFFKDYVQAFGDDNHTYGFTRATSSVMLSYDATEALLLASQHTLEKKSLITSDDIRGELAALTGTNAFQGVTGQIAFGRDGNPINKAVTVICNKNGYFMLDAVIGQFLLNEPPLTGYPTTSACA